GQRQACRRCGRLATLGKECRELGVVVDGTKAISDLEIEVPARERGTGHALGFVRDRIAGGGLQGHTGTPSQEAHRYKGEHPTVIVVFCPPKIWSRSAERIRHQSQCWYKAKKGRRQWGHYRPICKLSMTR